MLVELKSKVAKNLKIPIPIKLLKKYNKSQMDAVNTDNI
jgi:hypothetical protein